MSGGTWLIDSTPGQEKREHNAQEDEAGSHETGAARRAHEGVLDRLDRLRKGAKEHRIAEAGRLLGREGAHAASELFTRSLPAVLERRQDLAGGFVDEVGDQARATWRQVG